MNEKLIEIEEKLDFLINNFIEPKEIFTTEEACEYLRVGRTKFDNAVKRGEIRFKNNGSKRIFKKAWLDNWMEMWGERNEISF